VLTILFFLAVLGGGCFMMGYAIGTKHMTKHLRASNDHNQKLTDHINSLNDPADWWKKGDGTCGQ
jgi:hypothetical protein